MTSRLHALCVDAYDPFRLGIFWAGVLGWDLVDDADDGIVLLPSDDTGFQIDFFWTTALKVRPNQMHFDLTSTSLEDQKRTVAKALKLGGSHLDIGQGAEATHVVLADLEGNEFCVIEPGTAFSQSAASSERSHPTGPRSSGTSGGQRSIGRWSGTRTRRPRSARLTAARRSPGAVRHFRRRPRRTAFTSTSRHPLVQISKPRSTASSVSGRGA